MISTRSGLLARAASAAAALLMGCTTFAQEQPAANSAQIEIHLDQPAKKISSDLFGIFFEDLNYAADGGLYAEMVQNRSFEHRESLYSWSQIAPGGAKGALSVESEAPLNANNLHFLRLHFSLRVIIAASLVYPLHPKMQAVLLQWQPHILLHGFW